MPRMKKRATMRLSLFFFPLFFFSLLILFRSHIRILPENDTTRCELKLWASFQSSCCWGRNLQVSKKILGCIYIVCVWSLIIFTQITFKHWIGVRVGVHIFVDTHNKKMDRFALHRGRLKSGTRMMFRCVIFDPLVSWNTNKRNLFINLTNPRVEWCNKRAVIYSRRILVWFVLVCEWVQYSFCHYKCHTMLKYG